MLDIIRDFIAATDATTDANNTPDITGGPDMSSPLLPMNAITDAFARFLRAGSITRTNKTPESNPIDITNFPIYDQLWLANSSPADG